MLADSASTRGFFAALSWPLAAATGLALSLIWLDPRGPIVALLVNAFLLFEVAGFASVFDLSFPERYFRPRAIERPWLYEWIGVRLFKRAMRSRLYRRINPDFRLRDGRRGLARLREALDSSEAAHAVLFLIVAALAAVAMAVAWFDAAGWLMFWNVLLNGYPVMLQRYNRLRLSRLDS